jgi:hypothetical protein
MLVECGWNVDENGVLATRGEHFVVVESALCFVLQIVFVGAKMSSKGGLV